MENTTTHTPEGEKQSQTSLLHSARIHGSLALVLILLAAFLFAQTINALKEYKYIGGGISPSNAITVAGEGEVFAVPDTAEFTFSIIEEGATATEVQERATTKTNDILAVLKEQGVEEKDVKTLSYMVAPKYEWQPLNCPGYYPCERKQVQIGFTLDQSVQVKVRDMGKAGELVTLTTDKGAKSVSGVSFTVADEDAAQASARKLAIDEARAKAEKLATDLGVNLVRIVGFYEEQGGMPIPYMAMSSKVGMGGDAVEESVPAVLPAGENQFKSRVNITYEIR